jgi:hypothetical protein
VEGGAIVNDAILAEIVSPPQRDPYYQVDDITAAMLPGLCVKLLAAGVKLTAFDPIDLGEAAISVAVANTPIFLARRLQENLAVRRAHELHGPEKP